MLSYQPVLHPPMPMCSSTCSSATMAETESLSSEDVILPFSPQPASNIHWIIFDILTFTHMFQKCIKASKCFWEGWQNRLNSYTNLFSFHRKGGKKPKSFSPRKFCVWVWKHNSNITKSRNSNSQHNLPYWNNVTKHMAYCLLLNITYTLHSVLPN